MKTRLKTEVRRLKQDHYSSFRWCVERGLCGGATGFLLALCLTFSLQPALTAFRLQPSDFSLNIVVTLLILCYRLEIVAKVPFPFCF
jgi:hypothetical protein